jgi:uncharacterized membrane protein YvlD (DUF360 family)
MKLLLSIASYALVLFVIASIFPYSVSTGTGVEVSDGWRVYAIGGVILGFLSWGLIPILKIVGFPFRIITLGAFNIVIYAAVLYVFQQILIALNMGGMYYNIYGVGQFLFAVAIFTVFNTIHAMLFG